MLLLGESGYLARQHREQARAIAARQKLEPFALGPAENGQRAAAGKRARPAEIGGHAEDGADAGSPRELQREGRAEHPGVCEGGWRESEVLLECRAALCEFRGDERAEFLLACIPAGKGGRPGAVQPQQLRVTVRTREEVGGTRALDEGDARIPQCRALEIAGAG